MGSLLATLVVTVLIAALLLGAVVVLMSRLRKTSEAKEDLEGEERRMFDFLHLLGQAIEGDFSSRKLFRVIVEGMEEVLGAKGVALYTVSPDGTALVPTFLSRECPPLFELPESEREEIGNDAQRLRSYLRLTRVPEGKGLLWDNLRAASPGWVKDMREFPGLQVDEVMLAPVTHAGRDFGILAAVGDRGRRVFNNNDYEVFRSLAEQSSFALGNSIIHREVAEKRELERELRMASEVQRVLLPGSDPETPGFRIHGTNVPARIVSGDYYDYLTPSENSLGVAIADVSGKGVAAGLLMATCRSALRALAENCDSPASALALVNRQLFTDMREDMFISMVYVLLEEDGNRMRFARAGHEAPLMFRQETGEVEVLKPGGLALGIDEGAVFERVTIDFETEFRSGDCLLLYTDGVTEAENRGGEEFGKERLQEGFRKAATLRANPVVDQLQEELKRFVGSHRQMDDITMIAIERI